MKWQCLVADHGYMTSLVVAAFDFGTTYSGYAYSYRHNPTEVHTNESWYTGGASSQLVSLKTATCVLLDDKGKFNSFGFEAEDKFAALTMQRKNEGWRLFRRFKMHLHNIKVILEICCNDYYLMQDNVPHVLF
ncbi:hypothetical protein DPMN_182824 [Dreissena polymorpha]|uniref:Uncharacterized protein n=1 Tax=Dreissena polymorpha TaxID=45954 RepID=A0A9D4DFJ7_DREPO|nr:hypothetical protein DPMN_182824 [Dreissena polymorpha]